MTHQSAAHLATRSIEQLEQDNRELQMRLHEAEETIRAIQTGSVDALMVEGELGQQVYTLEGADRPYRLVIEQMQQGAATLLDDGTIAYCNTAFAVLLKVPHQKLVGASFWDYVVPEDAARHRSLVAQAPSSVQSEVRLLRSDGEQLYTYVTFNSLSHASGASTGVLVTDLTFQRYHEQLSSAHQALQENEARFREIIDSLPTAIYSTDADGRLTHFNPACVEFSGRMPELGTDRWCITWKLFNADGSPLPLDSCPMAIALKEGRSLRGIEAIAERPDGSRIWFTPYPTLLRNAAGVVVGGINMLVDITDRKLAQQQKDQELRDTKLLQHISAQLIQAQDPGALYAEILQAAVTLMKADKGTIQLYDAATDELRLIASHNLAPELHAAFGIVTKATGTSCAFALQTHSRAIIPDFSQPEHHDTPASVAHRAAGVLAAQTTPLLTRSGELLGMMSTHWSEPWQADERALRMLDILARQAADLIERKKAEDALKQSKVALTDADRRKDEFLATLAHELRNPLAPIRNGLHIMRSELAGVRIDELRDMMDRQVTHLVRLIDDLLDVSRVSQGKIDLRKQRITLQSAVEAATEASRPLIEGSGHRLTLTLPEAPIWLDADLTRIAQVLGNLLNNAAKYTPEGGNITVSARSDGTHAVMSVSDTGVGIPADMLPKVFDLFTQVDRNLERSQGGLGIGLALVRQLVAMHGGTIEASSGGVDRGSMFTIRLPLAATGTAALPQADATALASATTPPQRVLVVDDNVPAAETTGWMLEVDGHKVEYAYDAHAALAAAPAFRPNVILLDIGLPGMNGYDLCRVFRQDDQFRNTLIIAQTGWGQERDRQLAKDAGFDHYLVKPVKYDDLEALLARAFTPGAA
jgi:PAS domain S-box-containing protein